MMNDLIALGMAGLMVALITTAAALIVRRDRLQRARRNHPTALRRG